jgi:capsular polysaccharide biosynthesis protein
MNTHTQIREYIKLVKNKRKTFFVILVVFLVSVSIITFLRPLRYGSISRLLVVQNFSVGADPYALSRSNEFFSGLLADVITTDSFYDAVMNSGYNIDRSYFNKDGNYNKALKKWEETVSAKSLNNRGTIEIEVYHSDKYQLAQIAQAVNYILETKHADYHGGGNSVEVKIMNKPVISDYPVSPNIVLNYLLALIMSVVVFLVYIYLFPEEQYDLYFWPKKNTDDASVYNEETWNTPETVGEFYEQTENDYDENNISNDANDVALAAEEILPVETEIQSPYVANEEQEGCIAPEEVEAQEDEFFSRETDEDNYDAKGSINNLIG